MCPVPGRKPPKPKSLGRVTRYHAAKPAGTQNISVTKVEAPGSAPLEARKARMWGYAW
jgi:hypothetical protein